MDDMGSTLDELVPYIEDGTVIPVISNSFRLEQIFREDDELVAQLAEVPRFYDEVRTIEQQLTKQWAKDIGYPMSDNHNLARVAQYLQVDAGTGDPERAKREYLKFLNKRLLQISEKREGYESEVERLKTQTRLLFSEAVQRLDYPHFPAGVRDPLELLADLPLPIYITTSYFNFLEKALVNAKKQPRTQLLFLSPSGTSVVQQQTRKPKDNEPGPPTVLPDPDYVPDADNPAVYHLFGLENYRQTLVLSEDDHMNFLMNAVEEITSRDQASRNIYPSALEMALPGSRLVLLGYNLRDWDFRTLFQLILRVRSTDRAIQSIAIQLKPKLKEQEHIEKSLKYLRQYFEGYRFRVAWTPAGGFINELWKAWKEYIG